MSAGKHHNGLKIGGVEFLEAPSEIEGSPYWVDLWASVNGYRVGLQVKPKTYRSASVATYAGKALAGQRKGHHAFSGRFGGKVFTVDLVQGKADERSDGQIAEEVRRLRDMPPGPHDDLRTG